MVQTWIYANPGSSLSSHSRWGPRTSQCSHLRSCSTKEYITYFVLTGMGGAVCYWLIHLGGDQTNFAFSKGSIGFQVSMSCIRWISKVTLLVLRIMVDTSPFEFLRINIILTHNLDLLKHKSPCRRVPIQHCVHTVLHSEFKMNRMALMLPVLQLLLVTTLLHQQALRSVRWRACMGDSSRTLDQYQSVVLLPETPTPLRPTQAEMRKWQPVAITQGWCLTKAMSFDWHNPCL